MIDSPFFPPGVIPYLPNRNYYPTDTSNFPDIRDAAENLESECIEDSLRYQYAGWRNVGRRDSIGIFLWNSLSDMDRRVGRAVNERRNLVGGMNGTLSAVFNITDGETQ